MRLSDYILRAIRNLIRLFEWASGRRHYPWTSSPPHRLFAMIANRVGGWPGAQYRAVYGLAAAILKFRERLHADEINLSLHLSSPINAQALANTASWQHEKFRKIDSSSKRHVNIRVLDDHLRAIQLDRLISLLLTSDAIGSVNLFFQPEALSDARIHALTVAEEKKGVDGYDPAVMNSLDVEDFDDAAWTRVFSNRTGFDRNVNQYLKIAHPDALVVALSVQEDDDGFCDRALDSWMDAVAAFNENGSCIDFVVLNRVGPCATRYARSAARNAVTFASRAGMSTAEAIFLAQKADAYVGPIDVFGMAARASRRPGIYFLSDTQVLLTDGAHEELDGSMLAPRDALLALCKLLPRRDRDVRADHAHEACGVASRATDQAVESAQPLAAQPTESVPVSWPSAKTPSSPTLTRTPSVTTVQAFASQARELSGYTLIVPTYNRPALLERLIGYLERSGASFPILVLDSSDATVQTQNAQMLSAAALNAQHILFPSSTDPYAKMRDGVGRVQTSYCSLCADDDFILLPTVSKCIKALEREPTAAAAHGYYFNFRDNTSFDLSHIVYRGRSIDAKTPLARLRMLFMSYEAIIYGVYRTVVARRAFRDVDRVDTVLAQELLTGAVSVIAGPCLRIPEFYYGRNTAESLSYRAWHPHQVLAEVPSKLFTSYPVFREFVLQALEEQGVNPAVEKTADIVDLIMLGYVQPFLRDDVLDVILDQKLLGKERTAIVNRVWDTFVRSERLPRRAEPLLDRLGAFAPQMNGAGRARDYMHESSLWNGTRREYKVFYDFLYPDLRPPAATDREQLVALLASIDRY